jgi:NADH dehydrogenase
MAAARVVIVGAGFAGYHAARRLTKGRGTRGRAAPATEDVEVVLINPTDFFLYLPMLPEVSAGVVDPRHVAVSLAATLPSVRCILGNVDHVDVEGRTVSWTDVEGRRGQLGYDRLVLAAGGVNKLLPIPGVAENAHGFRGLPEALYLRDHLVRQLELAASTDDQAERTARCTFVVVGAGYTGTEVAAHCSALTHELATLRPELRAQPLRWILLDVASRVLPELDERLSRAAHEVLRARNVEVRMEESVEESTSEGVRLTGGEFVPTRSLIWCVGVRADPLIEDIDLPSENGRLTVDPYLNPPGHPEVFACGDAAAVPDLTRRGEPTAMTAQHAVRQGKLAARNVAASLGQGRRRRYRHRDLGFVVDLGAGKATANPLHIPLSGFAARVVTRGYHLAAMPTNRIRIVTDWVLGALLKRQSVQLGLVRGSEVPLDTSAPETPTSPRQTDH